MRLADAFLSDIVDHRDDDAPRLIFADWLDEHGEPQRAELIRLQCRRASLPAGDPNKFSPSEREEELLDRHASAWRASLPRLEGVAWGEFHRGFVESVDIDSVEAFLAQAPALFAAAPVQSVKIIRIDPVSGLRLAASPHLARLIELNLGNHTGLCPDSVRSLARSPYLENLESLLLHNNDLGDEAIADLAQSTHLGGLRELYVSGTELGDSGASALADNGRMPQLINLDLRDNHIGDNGVRRLASSMRLYRLSTLWLVNNQIGEQGADALAMTARLPSLQCLYLNYNPIGDAGVQALAASAHRDGLIELDLRHCDIHDVGGQALARSLYLEQLKVLWLSGNRLGTGTLTLLRRRFGEVLRI